MLGPRPSELIEKDAATKRALIEVDLVAADRAMSVRVYI
jgi:hypothetical protein